MEMVDTLVTVVLVWQHEAQQEQQLARTERAAVRRTRRAASIARTERAVAEAVALAEAEALVEAEAVDAVDAAVIQNQHQRPDVKDSIVLRIASYATESRRHRHVF